MDRKTKEDTIAGLITCLDKMDSDERVAFIDNIIHRMRFERRVTLLTEKQQEHMHNKLSAECIHQLDNCKTEREKEALIESYARSKYFKDCAWVTYLNDGGSPPCPSK